MNTRAIRAASEVIFRAMEKKSMVPATIALALDATGMLASPEEATTVVTLRATIEELSARLEIAGYLHGVDDDVDEKAAPS
ncbi:hypothetical protein ACFY7H_13290 [Streptomyces sp. NPDC012794]|uniref:hypothetical protein n=1 Tax=Streptomyces sp. NPDC012794 TaxID=3364850 RepID=UPI0036A4942E